VAANLLAQAVSDAIASHIFGVVPLFVLTGFLVAHADVGKDAFEVANQAFRRIRGGLGVATVAANAVFAAITGISIASAAVFTRVAVPQMLRFGYQPALRHRRGGRLVGAGHADPAQPADDPVRLPVRTSRWATCSPPASCRACCWRWPFRWPSWLMAVAAPGHGLRAAGAHPSTTKT
jgi:hypothetical protein